MCENQCEVLLVMRMKVKMEGCKMKKILFMDTTLRDGEQSPGVNLNEQEKLQGN